MAKDILRLVRFRYTDCISLHLMCIPSIPPGKFPLVIRPVSIRDPLYIVQSAQSPIKDISDGQQNIKFGLLQQRNGRHTEKAHSLIEKISISCGKWHYSMAQIRPRLSSLVHFYYCCYHYHCKYYCYHHCYYNHHLYHYFYQYHIIIIIIFIVIITITITITNIITITIIIIIIIMSFFGGSTRILLRYMWHAMCQYIDIYIFYAKVALPPSVRLVIIPLRKWVLNLYSASEKNEPLGPVSI